MHIFSQLLCDFEKTGACFPSLESRQGSSRYRQLQAKLDSAGRVTRSRAAMFTRFANEFAFIFCMTLPRCAFTVISLMPSSPPTCLFSRPDATNVTSRSRSFQCSALHGFHGHCYVGKQTAYIDAAQAVGPARLMFEDLRFISVIPVESVLCTKPHEPNCLVPTS